MSKKETMSLIYENQVISSMNHPNIIKSGGYYSDSINNVLHHYMVTENITNSENVIQRYKRPDVNARETTVA